MLHEPFLALVSITHSQIPAQLVFYPTSEFFALLNNPVAAAHLANGFIPSRVPNISPGWSCLFLFWATFLIERL